MLIHVPSRILQLFFGASRRHAFKICKRHTPRYLVFNRDDALNQPDPDPADPFEYSKSEGCQVGEAVAGGSAVAECSRSLPLRFRGWSSCVLPLPSIQCSAMTCLETLEHHSACRNRKVCKLSGTEGERERYDLGHPKHSWRAFDAVRGDETCCSRCQTR